jgi:translation initiation factor IF-2
MGSAAGIEGKSIFMSKIRIYELAKELEVENKALLDVCENLGISGKKSHSSALSDDEADRLRRAFIRKNLTDDATPKERAIEGGAVVERRVGNVIRRRKKSDEELQAEERLTPPVEQRQDPIDLKDLRNATNVIPSLAPDFEAERNSRNDALAAADALFRPSAPEPAALDEVQEEQPEEENAVESVGTEAAVVEESVASYDQPASEEVVPEAAKEARTAGPRVLGRIDLPVQREIRKPVVEKRATPAPLPHAAVDHKGRGKKKDSEGEDDEVRRPKKKLQVLRKDDLVDYDGDRDAWRSRRARRGAPNKRQEGELGVDSAGRPVKRVVKVNEEISVGEFAKSLGVKAPEVITQLMKLGIMAGINQMIDFDTALVVGETFGATVLSVGDDEEETLRLIKEPDADEALSLRAPVVTVMGHVDHGKTSLLDAIRKTSVTAGEAGGITQHIGAYNVTLPNGGSVTFLDTPGHEAFTAMRSRGAQLTDIVVLVVAADDGVMPQTEEAINHAKAAEVPIIVAINKIDKEGANVERIRNQLAEKGLIPEEWGGDTIFVPVSAHTREGLDLLLENLHLQAEVLELRANPARAAFGTVVESKLDKGRGPVLTLLIQNGTLRRGDCFLAGTVYGRVRAMHDSYGQQIQEAGPSMPVEVLGASGTPGAGDDFFVLESETLARELSEKRLRRSRARELSARGGFGAVGPLTLENFAQRVAAGEMKELPLIIKGDVHGSVEAVHGALAGLANQEAKVKVIHRGVGGITENDVQLAAASGAVLIGFNVRADSRAAQTIEDLGVQVIYSRIIYELVDSVKASLSGMLAPETKERTLGRVEVRQTFKVPKFGVVAGSYVVDGTIQRGALVRLLRDNRVIHEGKMGTLRRFKEDVREVQAGYECGISIDGYTDIKDGDIIEVYKIEEVPRSV